jgi:hypothetical protein
MIWAKSLAHSVPQVTFPEEHITLIGQYLETFVSQLPPAEPSDMMVGIWSCPQSSWALDGAGLGKAEPMDGTW